MANVTIDTHCLCSMAVDTPAHRLIYFSTDSMHLSDLAVTRRAFESRSNVRLVRVKSVCFRFDPIHAPPGRLLILLSERCQLLNFRAIGFDRVVTTHARRDVWNRRMRRLVHILMTEDALELRAFVFGHVLPMVKLNWLARRERLR